LRTVAHGRLALLMDTLGEIAGDEPVIIWAKFRRSIQEIAEAIADAYGPEYVHIYHGGLSERQRHAALERWRRSPGGYLIATQSAGGHGLTLNEAAYSVFYADGFKYSERVQAEDRNHRIGQGRRPVYITLRCHHSIDDRIQAALARKGNALELFQARVNKYRSEGLKGRAVEMVKSL
jgi:SNF2 family DNA or RNA helicase